jgi:CBS domain containing-hemolysin-like protein
MFEIIVIIVCLGLNALFACFEMAFVTVSKAQLRQHAKAGVKAAGRLLSLRETPERTLSANLSRRQSLCAIQPPSQSVARGGFRSSTKFSPRS